MIEPYEYKIYSRILTIASNGDDPRNTTINRIYTVEELERMRKRIDEIEQLWN